MLVGVAGGKTERIAVLPSGTRESPYITTATRDYDDIRVVMSDTVHGDNAGEVVYRAAIR